MNPSNLPNLISILRIILVVPVVILMLKGKFDWALGLFIFAGLTDALDGLLAKRFNWVTQLGQILDPLADKLLMVSSFLVLAWLGFVPVILVIIVIVRDIIIVLGVIVNYVKHRSLTIAPSLISKANTTAQVFLISLVLFSIAVIELPTKGLNAIFALVILTSLVSGIHYIIIWKKHFFKSRFNQ